MLRTDHAVKRACGGQGGQIGGTFCPDHAIFQACKVGVFGHVGHGAHAGAVCAEGHHPTLAEEFHTGGVGVRVSGRFAIHHICNKTAACW